MIKIKWTDKLVEEIKEAIEKHINGLSYGPIFVFPPECVDFGVVELAPLNIKSTTITCDHHPVEGVCKHCGWNVYTEKYEWTT